MNEKRDFEELRGVMGELIENPANITEILLGMPRDKYEVLKQHLFREAFPDEQSVVQFINNLYIKQHIKDIPNFAYQIIDFLLTEQDKIALFNSEFWKDGDITLGEVKKRILEIIKKDAVQQNELFPVFTPSKSKVDIKKEVALNFGGLERIEKEYKKLLTEKLSSGLTLQQHIDKVKDWFNNLQGQDLGNWIKLFAYTQAVKDFSKTEGEAVNFREISPGRYSFKIKRDHNFFKFFIRRDKKTGQYATKTKNKFLKWLHDNQNTIEFPMIMNEKVWNIPMRIYEFAENVSDKEFLFVVDTNILDSEFNNYVSIDTDEINLIDEIWEHLTEQNTEFKKYSLSSFVDVPLKFLLTLTLIYSEKGNFTSKSGFEGNRQWLTKESLNLHLGNLEERIKKHLQKRDKAGEKSTILRKTIALILENTWETAIKRHWLVSEPKIKDGIWYFNINPAYFAKKQIAKRLKAATPETLIPEKTP